MDKNNLKKIIEQGEGISVEFKKSKNKLNKNVFESVCAFLNRNGGHLFLGVDDKGTISGVEKNAVDDIVNSFVTTANNPQKLYPPFYMSPEVVEFGGKTVVHIFIPESFGICRSKNRMSGSISFIFSNPSMESLKEYISPISGILPNNVLKTYVEASSSSIITTLILTLMGLTVYEP